MPSLDLHRRGVLRLAVVFRIPGKEGRVRHDGGGQIHARIRLAVAAFVCAEGIAGDQDPIRRVREKVAYRVQDGQIGAVHRDENSVADTGFDLRRGIHRWGVGVRDNKQGSKLHRDFKLKLLPAGGGPLGTNFIYESRFHVNQAITDAALRGGLFHGVQFMRALAADCKPFLTEGL